MNVNDLISVSDATEQGITMNQLYYYIGRKEIPHVRIAGRILLDRKEFAKWLESKQGAFRSSAFRADKIA